MGRKPKPWRDVANWIVLSVTCTVALAHAWLFGSMGGDVKDMVGGFIIGLVPGYIFSVVVVPICGLVIAAQKSPGFFVKFLVLPAIGLTLVMVVLSGF